MSLVVERRSKNHLGQEWDFGNHLGRVGRILREDYGVRQIAASHLHLTPSLKVTSDGEQLTWEGAMDDLQSLVVGYANALGLELCGGWVTPWTGVETESERSRANILTQHFCRENPSYKPVYLYTSRASELFLENRGSYLEEFSGLKIHKRNSEVYPDFDSIAKLAGRTTSRVVFIHPHADFLVGFGQLHSFAQIVKEYPEIKFVFTHCACLPERMNWGGYADFDAALPSLASRAFENIKEYLAGLPNIFFDLSWVMDCFAIQSLLLMMGPDKLIFSLDLPSTSALAKWEPYHFIIGPEMRKLSQDFDLGPIAKAALRNEKTGRTLDMPTIPWFKAEEIASLASFPPPLLAMPEAIIGALDRLVRTARLSPEGDQKAAKDIFFGNYQRLFGT